MTSYLEIYSAYRDRNMWPNPAEFEVLVSVSGRKSASNSDDPVALASPETAWSSGLFDVTNPGSSFVKVAVVNSVMNLSFTTLDVSSQSPGTLQRILDYYKFSNLRDDTDPSLCFGISSYSYTGNDKATLIITAAYPFVAGQVLKIEDPTDFSNLSNPKIFVPAGLDARNAYAKTIVYNETILQYKPAASYAAGILYLATDVPLVGWSSTDNYSIRKEAPVLVTNAAAGSTSNTVKFGSGAANVDNMYVGWFLRIPKTVYDYNVVQPQGEQRRIVAYDGATNTATVSPPFTSTSLGSTVELQQFSYDNLYPFPYRATLQQEIPTYAMRLNKLILPNRELNISGGGRIAYKNYVYVELSGIDNPNVNLLFSNNPNATRALFTASVTNIENLDRSSYVVLQGDDMTQPVRFRLDTNFKFRITMPDGEVFETVIQDTKSPQAPDPKIQIRALFQLEPANLTTV
jgi:hypothetical protein